MTEPLRFEGINVPVSDVERSVASRTEPLRFEGINVPVSDLERSAASRGLKRLLYESRGELQ